MYVRQLKRGLVRVLGPIGGYSMLRRSTRHSPRIFMYHRFSESLTQRAISAATFDRHLSAISRHFQVITLAELGEYISGGKSVPSRTAVITVDDGYGDFADIAFPILQRHNLRATLFVSTRYTDGDFWLWPDKVEFALFNSPRADVEIEGRHFSLNGVAERWQSFDRLCEWFTSIADEAKHSHIASLLDNLEVDLPTVPTVEYAPVGWDRLKELSKRGIEIGAHTQTHPVLSQLPARALEDEISGSKSIIESHLGCRVSTFCYPNGQPEDINEDAKAAVRRAGYSCAVSAYFAHDVLADRYEIKRYSASENEYQFRSNLNGVELLSSALNRRFGI